MANSSVNYLAGLVAAMFGFGIGWNDIISLEEKCELVKRERKYIVERKCSYFLIKSIPIFPYLLVIILLLSY